MNPASRLYSAISCFGFRPTSTAPDAPAPASGRWFVDTPGGLQSLLQDVFGSKSSRIIEDLYTVQQKIRATPAADGQGPDFTFLNALEFFGEKGNRSIQLSEAASPATKADYQKMVDHLQKILNSPEFLAVTKAIASKKEGQHLRNKGILSCLVVGVIVAACFLGGCFMVPLPVYILLGASALGAAGMQLWYTFQERSCTAVAQAELGDLLPKISLEAAYLAGAYSNILSISPEDQEFFLTLSAEECVFAFQLCALWKSLLRSSLLDQLDRAVQKGNAPLCQYLLKPLGYLCEKNAVAPDEAITSLWFQAVKQGHWEVCKVFLQSGGILSTIEDKDGLTAFHHTMSANNWVLFVALLDSGNRQDDLRKRLEKHATSSQQKCFEWIWRGYHGSPLRYAILSGDEATVKRLLEIPDRTDLNTTDNIFEDYTLHEAIIDGNQSMCSLLLQYGANVHATNHEEFTALICAANSGHEAICTLLLQHGANIHAVDRFGFTALHRAAFYGHEAVCTLLLQHGANIHAASKAGYTILGFAALGGHEAICKLLLQHGANIHATNNDGYTALHNAAISGHACALLLQHGANIHATNNEGYTALHFAAQWRDAATCALLLQHGANIHATNNDGYTALHEATRWNIFSDNRICKPIFLLLLRHGADVNNIRTKDGHSPLTLAFQRHKDSPQHKGLFLFLLQADGDVNHIFELNENGGIKPKWDPIELEKYLKALVKPFLKIRTNLLEKATASGDPMDNRQIPTDLIEDIIAPFLI